MATKAKTDEMMDGVDPFAAFEAVDPSVAATAAQGGGAAKEDPVIFRRARMIEGVETQIALWKDPNYTVEKTIYAPAETGSRRQGQKVAKIPRKWFKPWAGKYVVICKYGARSLMIGGKEARAVEKDKMLDFFNLLIQEVQKGTFDNQLEKLSQRKMKE